MKGGICLKRLRTFTLAVTIYSKYTFYITPVKGRKNPGFEMFSRETYSHKQTLISNYLKITEVL
jgi:hypothetical protein